MKSLSPYIETLRKAGRRLTRARLCVLRVLESEQRHFTSSELLRAVAAQDSSVGRASVFRALDLFTQLGIVRPTYIGGQMTPSYVLMAGGHHHHVICNICHAVFDFDNCSLEALSLTLEDELGIHIEGHLLEFYGRCADCQAAAS